MTQATVMRNQETDQIEVLREQLAKVVARSTNGLEQFATAIPGLTFYRRESPTEPNSCLVEPSVAFVIQGTKQALLGDEAYVYDIKRFLITSLDLPAMMQIVEASQDKPYLGVVLRLDLRVMTELMVQGSLPSPREHLFDRGMVLGETTLSMLHGIKRLLDLLDEPEAIPILASLIQREIYYRLLMSDQGARLRQIISADSQSQRIARAIDWLKSNYARSLRIEELASHVQMSVSTFHHHFRLLTTMSPLQYQKWLRLNEARRLMLASRFDASTAAFQVGYESPSQFSREYSRLFGSSPRRDIENLRNPSGIDTAASQPQIA